jgi:hypothetical protein
MERVEFWEFMMSRARVSLQKIPARAILTFFDILSKTPYLCS